MNDAERRLNAAESFDLAVMACREGYLRNRIGDETAAEYVARRRAAPAAPEATYPVVARDCIGGPIRLHIHAPTETGGTSTTSSVVSPMKAIALGAELCALGASELSSKGR